MVIPAYNEADLLPRLFDSIDRAKVRYDRGADAVEVIVADNSSTDATAVLSAERGARVVTVAKRVIAAARNGGAAVANGTIVAFIDADSQIHPDTFTAIDRAMVNPRVVGGATGVRLERWSLGLAATFALLVPFVWLTRMDTGVVFCRRADFVRLGGYDDRRYFAEDLAFLWALKRLGWSRRQRLVRLRHAKVIASTRKFDRYGDWHYFTEMSRLVAAIFRRPHSLGAFARQYWYDDRGEAGRPPSSEPSNNTHC